MPAWLPPAFTPDHALALVDPEKALGTSFPFGCRWCGRSTQRDGVEICEQLGGIVHSDCHDDNCTDPACAYLVCTPDRCYDVTECDECYALSCVTHGVHVVCDL